MRRLWTWGLGLGAITFALLLMPTALAAPAQTETGDPAYSVDLATLDAALDCDEFRHPDTDPVLLVHGTMTSGHEQWDWSYAPFLRDHGHDVCIVTYPDRGLGDMQVSAEYVARAVQRIHAETGQMVDMVGHSQGALMPRWAIKYWPSVRAAIDDFVLLAGPNHGTMSAGDLADVTGRQPAVFFQFAADSNFVAALNADDETPGAIDYTSIYTRLDELVRPVDPPTAALDLATAGDDPRVTNIDIQDLCPLRVVEHLTIGTTDALTMRLVLDALDNDGPTDLDRVGVDETLCNLPDQYVAPDVLTILLGELPESLRDGLPELNLLLEEPPLRSYAIVDDGEVPADTDPQGDDADPRPVGESVDDAAGPVSLDETAVQDPEGSPGDAGETPVANETPGEGAEAVPTSTGVRQFGRTGRAIPILAAGIAIAVALLLRLGSSRIREMGQDQDQDAPDSASESERDQSD